MKLLLILLAVMSFTVQTKTSVSADGTWPYDMDVEYANSSSQGKGNVGKDDVAALMVTGLGGITVEKVEVYVKSNANAGAGSFEVRADGYTVGLKSGTFQEWTGAYDGQNYHSVSLLSNRVSNVHELTIQLIGTANSLHIDKYVITWGNAPARTVRLMYGGEVYTALTEEAGGQGVLIPTGPQVEGWWCVGWSKTGCDEPINVTDLVRPNNKFYPSEDCTLWAIYKYTAEDEMVYETDLQSGDYLYVNHDLNLALTGVPSNGRMASVSIDRQDARQIYTIAFAGTDTAYITHKETGTPIGYNGTQLAIANSPWLVYHEDDETLFYTIVNDKKYVLWHEIYDTKTAQLYAGLFQADELSGAPVALCSAVVQEPIYSCYPEGEMGMDEVKGEKIKVKGEWVFPFGSYNLIIQNGQKRLEIRD